MKSYQGTFVKQNGDERTMTFVRLADMPEDFIATRIKGTGKKANLTEIGRELVWDLDAAAFRVFNWKTAIGDIVEAEIEEAEKSENNT
jgi:hypothetical protein